MTARTASRTRTTIDDSALAQVIGGIYELAVDTAHLRGLGQWLAAQFGADSAVIAIQHQERITEIAVANLPKRAHLQHAEHDHRLSRRAAIGWLRPRLQAHMAGRLGRKGGALHTEFYDEFAGNCGARHVLGAVFDLTDDMVSLVALHRAHTAAAFDAADRRCIDVLLPHLQQALCLRRRMLALEAQALTSCAALNGLADGAIVVESDGVIVFANAAAKQLTRSGHALSLTPEGICAATPGHHQELRQLICEAAQCGTGGSMMLPGLKEIAPLAVLVAPLPRHAAHGTTLSLVLVKSIAALPKVAARSLADFYALSPAEADVAIALAHGQDVAAIARTRGVNLTTLRTQIRRILHKTGAPNLRALVRQFAGLPSLHPHH